MSIVKMKRLRLVALGSERARLMKRLQRLGCVELRPCPAPEGFLSPLPEGGERLSLLRERQRDAEQALMALKQYAYEKSPLFSTREPITETDFFADISAPAERACGSILEAVAQLASLRSERQAALAAAAGLALWAPLSVPLELRETRTTEVLIGSVPTSRGTAALREALEAVSDQFSLSEGGLNRERAALLLLYPKALAEGFAPILQDFRFERAPAGPGAASEQIARARSTVETTRQEETETLAFLRSCGEHRRLLRLYADRLTMELDALEADQTLLRTDAAFALCGWVDEPHIPALETLLGEHCCVWELSEPGPEDTAPVLLKSNRLTDPLNMVTEMYSLPDYRNVDPNPLIAPFFCVFFGMMFNDLGYGLVFILLSLLIQKKYRLYGGTKHLVQLMLECGVTTALMGLVTGSFFGDAIPVIAGLFGKSVAIPALLNPLENPMQVLILSLVCGVLHILFGMGVKAWLLIRDGKPWDALMDVGSWWLLFAGAALGALRGFWWLAIAGLAALVLTQGRAKPTLAGKLVGGLASLYDITSYFSDVLSYSRIMALMLAGGIVASIVNVLGSLFGSIVLFIPIFIIGHAFNIGINVIGTYVHAARLQYLEFFGKFYVDGGKPFRPLRIRSKYFELIQEESYHA